jgi:hypothetical protein
MSRKLMFALTAIAALGIAALSPTSASAHGRGGGGGGFHGGGHAMSHTSFGHGRIGGGRIGGGRTFGHVGHGPAFRHVGHFNHFGHFNRFGHDHFRNHWVWWRHYHRPYWVYPVVGDTDVDGGVAQPVAAAQPAPVAQGNCNCLTKNYLPDGSLMFKDVCTQEAAVATPDELKAQAAGAPPQGK